MPLSKPSRRVVHTWENRPAGANGVEVPTVVRSLEGTVVSGIGAVTGYSLKILGVVNTVAGIASAYSRCAP